MEKPIEVVKINKGDGIDEVFFYREDPYVNEVKYTEPGKYQVEPPPQEPAATEEETN